MNQFLSIRVRLHSDLGRCNYIGINQPTLTGSRRAFGLRRIPHKKGKLNGREVHTNETCKMDSRLHNNMISGN